MSAGLGWSSSSASGPTVRPCAALRIGFARADRRARPACTGFEQSRIKKRVALQAGSIFGVRSAAEQKRLAALAKVQTRGVDPRLFSGAAAGRRAHGQKPRHVQPRPAGD